MTQDPTVSPWVPGLGVFRAAAIADLGGHRGKLCRRGDRGGGWGAMAAGSVAPVGRLPPGVTEIGAFAARVIRTLCKAWS